MKPITGTVPNKRLTGYRLNTHAGAYSLKLFYRGQVLVISIKRKPGAPVIEKEHYITK